MDIKTKENKLELMIETLKEKCTEGFFMRNQEMDPVVWGNQNDAKDQESKEDIKLTDIQIFDLVNVKDLGNKKSWNEATQQAKIEPKIKNDFCVISIKSEEVRDYKYFCYLNDIQDLN